MSGATVIIPHYGDPRLTRQCLAAVRQTTHGVETILVDNASTPWLDPGPDVVVRPKGNLGFAAGCNLGAEVAQGDVLVFLNNDTIPQPGWLTPLVTGTGNAPIAGARLVYPDGHLQHAGVDLELRDGTLTAFNRLDEHPSGRVPAVTGACLAVNTDAFFDLNGFDDAYWNGYEDVDLCLRAGGAWYCAESTVVHLESQSGPERWTGVRRNIHLLHERWADSWLARSTS